MADKTPRGGNQRVLTMENADLSMLIYILA